MKLFIQFAKTDTLAEVIKSVHRACSIQFTNPASVPIEQDKDAYYFSLDVVSSTEQIRAALKNGKTDLGPKAEMLCGWDEEKKMCLFYHNAVYQSWYVDVLFKDHKLIANPMGIAIQTFKAP